MNALRLTLKFGALLVLAFTLFTTLTQAAPTSGATSSLEYRNAMRKLWEDHIVYTRLYIVSTAAGLPDADLIAQRLLQNQTDIGNAIKPFYGDDAGNQLTVLLKDHILGAAEVLAAAKAGDTAKFDAANQKWYANGDDIAVFLNAANPKDFPLDAMKHEMKMHLDLTLAEAAAHLKGDYAASIADYDKVHNHILGMADALSAGIVAQFPAKFGGQTPAVVPTTGMQHDHETDSNLWLTLFVGGTLVFVGLVILKAKLGANQ